MVNQITHKEQTKRVLNTFANWYIDLITHRMLFACLMFILGLTFIKGGPLSINIANNYTLTLLSENFGPDAFAGKVLILFGSAELIGLDLVTKVFLKILTPILSPILKPILDNQTIKSFLLRVSSKLPKESEDEPGDHKS